MHSRRSKDRAPTHPGAILREDVLPALAMSQEAFAKALGVSRRTISEVLHERRPITPDMAIRLSRYFGTTADSWLDMQVVLDLWKLERSKNKDYAKIKQLPPARNKKDG